MSAICGLKQSESFGYYDQDTASWRTSQASLILDISGESSLTFPKAGMMQNGVLSELTMSAPRIEGKGCGYWLTPSCMQIAPGEGRREKRKKYRESIGRKDIPGGLAEQVVTPQFWPTPRASEWKGTGPKGSKSQIHMFKRGYLNATVEEADGGEQTQQRKALNPAWVAWIMGFPIGWVSLEPMTESEFLAWQRASLTE